MRSRLADSVEQRREVAPHRTGVVYCRDRIGQRLGGGDVQLQLAEMVDDVVERRPVVHGGERAGQDDAQRRLAHHLLQRGMGQDRLQRRLPVADLLHRAELRAELRGQVAFRGTVNGHGAHDPGELQVLPRLGGQLVYGPLRLRAVPEKAEPVQFLLRGAGRRVAVALTQRPRLLPDAARLRQQILSEDALLNLPRGQIDEFLYALTGLLVRTAVWSRAHRRRFLQRAHEV